MWSRGFVAGVLLLGGLAGRLGHRPRVSRLSRFRAPAHAVHRGGGVAPPPFGVAETIGPPVGASAVGAQTSKDQRIPEFLSVFEVVGRFP